MEAAYYDARHPGSYSGVDKLYRSLDKKVSRTQLKDWLSTQDVYTLHKPVRWRFDRRRVVVGGMNHLWQADLADLSSISKYNDGYRYLLTCIDVLSKYAWVVPIKNKTGNTLVEAFEKILKTSGRRPRKLQTDKGSEFLNRTFQAMLRGEHIGFYTTENEDIKASVVERFNRTIKTKMWKYFTRAGDTRYIDILPDLVHSYNHTHHRSIDRTPASVTRGNEARVWQMLYAKRPRRQAPKLKVGDRVRISKSRRVFRKGYLKNFTEELFDVVKVLPTQPPTYRIADYGGEWLQGAFYQPELQKVVKKDDIFQIETILDRRRRGKRNQYLVKWLGYPNKFNSWIDEDDLV